MFYLVCKSVHFAVQKQSLLVNVNCLAPAISRNKKIHHNSILDGTEKKGFGIKHKLIENLIIRK